MRNFIFYFLLLTTTSALAQPTIEWQKTYGGSASDVPASLVKGSSGGFVITGTTASTDGDVAFNHGNFDIWTIRIDDAGALIGRRPFGGTFGDMSGQMSAAPSGNIQVGMSNSNDGDLTVNHGDYDFWVIKTLESGNLEWQTSLGGSNVDQGHSVASTADGGYIVAGSASSNDFDVSGNKGLDDYWIAKLSGTGDLEWQRSLGGTGVDKATAIIATSDGGYAVAGSSSSVDGDVVGNHGSLDYWIVKLSATGAIQWQISLGGNKIDEVSSIQQTPDGGYIIAGDTYSSTGDVVGNHGGSDIWVVKLSASGSIEWKKCYGGSADDQGIMIRPVTGGYILLANTVSSDGDIAFNHGNSDIWLAMLSSTGAILWQRSLGGSMAEFASDVLEVGPQEYIVLGAAQSFDGDVSGVHGDLDYWVVKLKCNMPASGISGGSSVCMGSSLVLAGAAFGGLWSASGGVATVSDGLVTGVSMGLSVISYSVTNVCGTQVATHYVNVLESPSPVITVMGDVLRAPTGFTQYQWYKDGTLIVGAVAAAYRPTVPGHYYVKVTSPNGCVGVSAPVTVATTSVASIASAAAIQVVPNPAKTSISIVGDNIAHVRVFNSVGAIVRNSDEARGIQVDMLPSGVYYVSVFDAGSQLIGRGSFIKD